MLISSLMVIIVQNSIYSVLFLVLSFVSAASLLLLFECEFIALMFVIKYFPIGFFVGGVLLLEICYILTKSFVE